MSADRAPLSTPPGSLREASNRVSIVAHDVRLSRLGEDIGDSAVMKLRLSSGDEVSVSVTPDSIGNVYTTTTWRRRAGSWEKIVSCLNDGVHEFIGRGRRHQT